MNCLVVNSSLDIAGKNIVKKLKENFPRQKGFEFLEVNEEIIFSQIPEKTLEGIDLVVFTSKHKSESGRPTLTCHAIGNFGVAKMGGKNNSLVSTNPIISGKYLRSMHKLNEERKLGFEVSLEVTHHGPYLEKPAVFIEVGSSEKEWGNEKAADIVAETIATQTILEPKDSKKYENEITTIGIGGGHYAPDFTKLVLKKNYSFGHICASHSLQNLNETLLLQMIEMGDANEIVLDWKGLKGHKDNIVALCEKTGLKISKIQKLLK